MNVDRFIIKCGPVYDFEPDENGHSFSLAEGEEKRGKFNENSSTQGKELILEYEG